MAMAKNVHNLFSIERYRISGLMARNLPMWHHKRFSNLVWMGHISVSETQLDHQPEALQRVQVDAIMGTPEQGNHSVRRFPRVRAGVPGRSSGETGLSIVRFSLFSFDKVLFPLLSLRAVRAKSRNLQSSNS